MKQTVEEDPMIPITYDYVANVSRLFGYIENTEGCVTSKSKCVKASLKNKVLVVLMM